MTVAVSVIVPNLHSPVVGKVLEALLMQADAVPAAVEVWVVGQDRYGQVKPRAPVHILTPSHPIPPAQARNLGATRASGETLIFLDADCIPQAGWLEALLAARARWPDAGAISGAMLPESDTFVLHCGQISGFHEHLSINPPGRRRLLASFSLLMPRAVWDIVGGFHSNLRVAEDVDLSVRLSQKGWPLYLAPQAKVLHRPSRERWSDLWQHALVSGRLSIEVRRRHRTWFNMPAWMENPWAWRILSPAIAAVRLLEIYSSVPGLWRYWHCAPWVLLSKFAWSWGAAAGLQGAQDDASTEA